MTGKEFLNRIGNGKSDVLGAFLATLDRSGARYCAIGGLAVNAYAEPVVSLDLDVVVAAEGIDRICASLEGDFRIERFPHSVNLTSPDSDLRFQIQTDPRYQDFLGRGREHEVLGYRMRVAAPEDVLQGKIWAWEDPTRRRSKRHKDLADILRLIEAHPKLADRLPESLRPEIEG